MRWRVYYVDGTSYSNEDGPPESAPGSGVVAVAQQDAEVGVAIHQRNDYYVYAEQYGGWYGLDVFGFAQYLTRPGFKVIKLAESMTTEGYKQLIVDIRADPGLPAKSAQHPWEPPF